MQWLNGQTNGVKILKTFYYLKRGQNALPRRASDCWAPELGRTSNLRACVAALDRVRMNLETDLLCME